MQGIIRRSERGRERSRFLAPGFGAAANGCPCLQGMLAASLRAGEEVWEAEQHCALPAPHITCL